ncbi:putative lipase KNAG_0J00780 [Huiozyma naganishii CBS 8797]|uniref:Temperature shock-inducible protein 1 n=1 Tax=Huiozyma naganishii (strain ATCC MYA-139 / BCRC 22969 / CBS 8797 / KCTC 17520 / NBRC 10181 / NCYC 3082 / Yp74L-3) TaxID=1071383 RepID=J7SAH1_HUIN7|nr:hypothetical protein KNAG_0J00780 [Kazachstania naganishii CBS 8797]CCK72161.1 hypothetical protein KNAG_0J00780 [Kazachstania naganishii CBS 8797]
MQFATFIAAIASSAAIASALTDEQSAEIYAIVQDINSNQAQYIGLEMNTGGFQIPPQLLSMYQQVLTYKDDSYTSLFTALDYNMITSTITGLSWYNERLAPALSSVRAKYNTAEATTSAKATTTTSAKETTTSAEATTSSKATTSAAPSSSAKASSSSAASKATTQAVSQITDGQIQQTASVHQQSANGAIKNAAGVGAGFLAAAALLM